MVAVSSGATTTALSDVNECSNIKRKQRDNSVVEDQPFNPAYDKEMILPSRWYTHTMLHFHNTINQSVLLICRAEVWRGPTSNIESSVEEGAIRATKRDSHNFAINILTLVEICPRLNISQNRMISLAPGKKLPPRVWQQALWWRLHLPPPLSSCNAQIASSTSREMLAVMALPTPCSLSGRMSRPKATFEPQMIAKRTSC